MSPSCLSSPETTSGSMRPAAPCVTPTLLEFILPTADLAGDLWPNLVWTVATLGRAVDAINQGRSSPLRIQVRQGTFSALFHSLVNAQRQKQVNSRHLCNLTLPSTGCKPTQDY